MCGAPEYLRFALAAALGLLIAIAVYAVIELGERA
jgi:hypothetical protein